MSEREFEAYLNLLARTLKLSEAQRERIAGELRDHLEERMDELVDQGMDRDAAILAALDEFGDANVLANDLSEPRKRLHRRRLMQTSFATLATAAVLATGFFYFLPAQSRTGQPMVPTTQAQATDDAFGEVAAAEPAVDPLDQIVTVNFSDAHLESVFDYFREVLGVNLFVQWDGLENIGIQRDTPFSMQLKDVRAGTALELLSDSLVNTSTNRKIGYELRENILVIGDAQRFEKPTPDLQTQMYDCADLLAHVYPSNDSFGRDRNENSEMLLGFVHDSLGEQAWENGESLSFFAGILVIRQKPELHEELHGLLDEMRDRLAKRAKEQIEVTRNREADPFGGGYGGQGYGGGEFGGGYGASQPAQGAERERGTRRQ